MRGPRASGAVFLSILGERTFYELAGDCARPVMLDGILWLREPYEDTWTACADIPSPEFLLV